ncbi:VPS10 domain-containing receptor SorCS1 [Thelohanellus kitauei]|uniref:VPS10 domain-containing receptor SorCS1 n=1 Tax=Thelohanellus kitauei TaxID=669202 RepID=A0A0C2NBA2_THEKT|nr:VPS10 domain-containing receptor SorCS1 [Thelohanellus kitauei]
MLGRYSAGFDFKKLEFIPSSTRFTYLSPDNTFKDIDTKNDDIKSQKPSISDFRTVERKTLLIQSNKVRKHLIKETNNLELLGYDHETYQSTPLLFPELVQIKEVKFFEVVGKDYYLILVLNDQNTCLWVSTEIKLKFGRAVCTNAASDLLEESNFYIDKKLLSQIFWNFPNQENLRQTLRSTNKGRAWYEMKFLNPNDSKYILPVHFKFSLYDHRDAVMNFKEIDIQYAESPEGRRPFISYDNGNTWRATPLTNLRLVMLGGGMVLVSVHTDTNFINYNFDHGKTWFREQLFENQQRVLYIGRLTNTDQKALIVTKDDITNKLIFSSIDFSEFFSFKLSNIETQCTSSQYESWNLHKSDGYCESDNYWVMSTRKPENYCVDHETTHIKDFEQCDCKSYYFGCAFGYRPFGDICVRDDLIYPYREPKVCAVKGSEKLHELGFIKMVLDENRCTPDASYGLTSAISTELCVNSDYTDFLILNSDEGMYMYRLSPIEDQIVKKRPVLLDVTMKERFSRSVAFDWVRQMTFTFKDTYIIEQPFFGTFEKIDV